VADSKPGATAMRQDVPFEPLAPTSLPEVPCGVARQMWGFPPMGKPWGNPLINDLQLVGFPHDLLVYSRVTDGLTMTKCGLSVFGKPEGYDSVYPTRWFSHHWKVAMTPGQQVVSSQVL